jgi:hypothetical protein
MLWFDYKYLQIVLFFHLYQILCIEVVNICKPRDGLVSGGSSQFVHVTMILLVGCRGVGLRGEG